MKNSLYCSALFFAVLSSFLFVACDNDDDDDTEITTNIVEFAQADPDFSILVDAVVKADLVDVLSSDGPFTLFAPDDDAFQAFLNAAGTNTIENTPKEVLVDVLTNHVLAGSFPSQTLANGYAVTLSATGFGQGINTNMYINVDQGITINGSTGVAQADINVSNGTIHVVDEVIAIPSIVTFALAEPSFSSLVEALTDPRLSTDFVDVLTGDGPFTVFAPTNAAFQALLNTNESWNTIADIPATTLEAVLLYHVTDVGNVRSSDLTNGQVVPTLSSGATVQIQLGNIASVVGGSSTANIDFADIQAGNGVVHVIDAVLLP